ncbi:zinc finger dhhc domain containing [Cordyceps militaris]|uniref:Zinc finger dhhc domain containing n=1 Tax=Cordyceps militaris TaxID=73501 RepID=A0A2H4SDD1_CORMI|nr:zinc finger dhhc domain containing [Cordyceps militaris]
MADRHRSYHHARPASTNPSRSSLPAGMVYQPSYADDSYLAAGGSRHPVTTPRGYSSTTTHSGQPATTRTYAVTQDPRSHPRTRDHSHTRRLTMDSVSRPPVIITTIQKDRPHNNSVHSAGVRIGSPVHDDYRGANSQYYAVPASTSPSRSSARPYHGEDHSRRRDRGDSLLSPRDAEIYRQSRPSVTYPSTSRHSAATIDYGDDGYRYTNAGELVQYDLDHSKPSRTQRHDSFSQGYSRPGASYAGNHRRSDGLRYEIGRGSTVPHERSDVRGGPPPFTRGFDKVHRDNAPDQDRQAPPAAPKPPRPISQSETSGDLRDVGETRHRRPVSVSQEPSYWHSSTHTRDDVRDRRGHFRDRSDDRTAGSRRPHSTQFYDDSIPNRGFGIRTSPEGTSDGRRDSRRDGRRGREESRRGDYLASGEELMSEPRKYTQDRMLPHSGESKHTGSDRRDSDRDASNGILEAAGTGLGITVAAAGLVASRKDNEPAGDLYKQKDSTCGPAAGNSDRPKTLELSGSSSTKSSIEATKDRHSPRWWGASLVKYGTPPASDSDDAGRDRMRRRQSPSDFFDPRNTADLRRIQEQLAALKMHDSQQQSKDAAAVEPGRQTRTPSPKKEGTGIPVSNGDDDGYAVGFPAQEKHTRLVSPPRDKRDDKPLKSILKQPSAKFPEEANPVREGVAPHKEDKKLKEVPPGARWTKVNRKVVNPEALTIGQERFEERDDFVIVLRVLSKEEIQAYAAATQVLRERRRNREELERGLERQHHDDDDKPRHHRRPRRHGGGYGDGGDDNDTGSETRDSGKYLDDEGKQKTAHDEGGGSSADQRREVDKDGERARRSRRDDQDGDAVGKRRDRAHDDDRGVDIERRKRAVKDDYNKREPQRSDGDRYYP